MFVQFDFFFFLELINYFNYMSYIQNEKSFLRLNHIVLTIVIHFNLLRY